METSNENLYNDVGAKWLINIFLFVFLFGHCESQVKTLTA